MWVSVAWLNDLTRSRKRISGEFYTAPLNEESSGRNKYLSYLPPKMSFLVASIGGFIYHFPENHFIQHTQMEEEPLIKNITGIQYCV